MGANFSNTSAFVKTEEVFFFFFFCKGITVHRLKWGVIHLFKLGCLLAAFMLHSLEIWSIHPEGISQFILKQTLTFGSDELCPRYYG